MARSITVLGVGNLLLTDEGVGVHAVRALAERNGQSLPDVEFLDGGTLGLNLLPYVEKAAALLILDAVDCGSPPGAVIELSGDSIPKYSGIKLSEHQVTLQEVLGLARIRGRLPARMILIGMQPADLSTGDSLSPVAVGALPEMLAKAEAVLREWILTPP
ncbi:MAG: HyaD/HybD family hydrogenase maturation endopeptidase [Anaerolineales bacterium]